VERLREGLFDPVAVRLLTANEQRLNKVMDQGLQALSRGESAHLSICGAYGQGKSHSLTYIEDRARRLNYVTSLINLDPREVPLAHFDQVYRHIMQNLRFPGEEQSLIERWRTWVKEQDPANGPAELIPPEIPHLFRTVLTGLAQKTLSLTPRQRRAQKHAVYRPREFPYILAQTLLGEAVPQSKLRPALKYRQVDFYQTKSLATPDNWSYFHMLQGLAQIFRQMGFAGLVILFDEAESIAQARVVGRGQSYQILDWFFQPQPKNAIFSVFAFTDDFFMQVEAEDYSRLLRTRGGHESLCFAKNFAQAWKSQPRHYLQDITPQEWDSLSAKLLDIHGAAYHWLPSAELLTELRSQLRQMNDRETRYRLKALIEQLDLAQQTTLL
jgi:hypothetical protein